VAWSMYSRVAWISGVGVAVGGGIDARTAAFTVAGMSGVGVAGWVVAHPTIPMKDTTLSNVTHMPGSIKESPRFLKPGTYEPDPDNPHYPIYSLCPGWWGYDLVPVSPGPVNHK